jgi:hypothetical protein
VNIYNAIHFATAWRSGGVKEQECPWMYWVTLVHQFQKNFETEKERNLFFKS